MILANATLATMTGLDLYGLIPNAAVVIDGPKIVWLGVKSELPSQYASHEQMDLQGRLITPGLIDCHTHIVFGGNRAHEFE